ncbi:MAG: membrane protein insertion efficiency factor YidD [Desulfamplus sp.]|nr:membrane protein insertion efficiency factor YidD [Desulfamplus sp.]
MFILKPVAWRTFFCIFFFFCSLAFQAESGELISPSPSRKGLFKFYKEYISPADGDRCGMSPSCSKYGQEAFARHGLLMGWIMTCDRLIRCGRDERNFSPSVRSNGKDGSQQKNLTFDPLDANDFWWYSHDSSR